MKKIYREGFVLAEAIVVAVFVLGTFTYLAVNIIPLITKYGQVLKYDNPQEVYAANILLDELIQGYFEQDTGIENLYPVLAKNFDVDDNYYVDSDNYYYEELKSMLNVKEIALARSPIFLGSQINCIDFPDFTSRAILEYCKFYSKEIPTTQIYYGNVYYSVFLIRFKNDNFASFFAYTKGA